MKDESEGETKGGREEEGFGEKKKKKTLTAASQSHDRRTKQGKDAAVFEESTRESSVFNKGLIDSSNSL